MATNNNNTVFTNIFTHRKFAKDKDKNQRFDIGLYQKTMTFRLFTADSNGTIKNTPDVALYFSALAYNESVLMTVCEEMLKRITRMSRGEDLKSDSISIHNGKSGFPSCTSCITFDAFNVKKDGTKMEKPMYTITLKKRESENQKDFSTNMTYYLSDGVINGMYIPGDTLRFKEAYQFYDQLRSILKGFSERTSSKRDLHWQKVLAEEKGENNNSSYKNNSTQPAALPEADLDDGFEF